MLYYICFVNALLEGLSSLDIGCSVGNSRCASIAYADDIAVCALHAPCIQAMIDYAWEYSNTWRFDFNIKKCAVLVYGESRGDKHTRRNNIQFVLGNQIIEERIQYEHLGIGNYVKNVFCKKSIQGNINKMKYAIYSLVGCSLRKTSLTRPSQKFKNMRKFIDPLPRISRCYQTMLLMLCVLPLMDSSSYN